MRALRRFVIGGLAVAGVVVAAADGQAQSENAQQAELVNQGTVGVMGASLSGTYTKFVWDMASMFDNGYDLRVLPILGKGSIRSIEDLLFLRGVDVALVQSDILDFMTQHNIYPRIHDRIRYITVLYDEEMHVVARNDIKSMAELQGKKVNFGPESSGTFITSSIVFEQLGLSVEASSLEFDAALHDLEEGKLDAMVMIAGAPVNLLESISWEQNLHILPINEEIEGAYSKVNVTSEQYPGLIAQGQTVETVAVGAVMAAYNWPNDSPRRQKVDRLVRQLEDQLDAFRSGPYHEKWKQVDLKRDLPGWTRWSTGS